MGDDSSGSLESKSLSNMRVVDLKLQLEKRGLSKSGSKKELVKRLKQKLELEKLYEESTAIGDSEPKLHLDEATEQNEFVKQYLAEQQKIYAQQKEAKRIIELREQQRLEEEEEETDSDLSESVSVAKNSCDSSTHAEEGEEEDRKSLAECDDSSQPVESSTEGDPVTHTTKTDPSESSHSLSSMDSTNPDSAISYSLSDIQLPDSPKKFLSKVVPKTKDFDKEAKDSSKTKESEGIAVEADEKSSGETNGTSDVEEPFARETSGIDKSSYHSQRPVPETVVETEHSADEGKIELKEDAGTTVEPMDTDSSDEKITVEMSTVKKDKEADSTVDCKGAQALEAAEGMDAVAEHSDKQESQEADSSRSDAVNTSKPGGINKVEEKHKRDDIEEGETDVDSNSDLEEPSRKRSSSDRDRTKKSSRQGSCESTKSTRSSSRGHSPKLARSSSTESSSSGASVPKRKSSHHSKSRSEVHRVPSESTSSQQQKTDRKHQHYEEMSDFMRLSTTKLDTSSYKQRRKMVDAEKQASHQKKEKHEDHHQDEKVSHQYKNKEENQEYQDDVSDLMRLSSAKLDTSSYQPRRVKIKRSSNIVTPTEPEPEPKEFLPRGHHKKIEMESSKPESKSSHFISLEEKFLAKEPKKQSAEPSPTETVPPPNVSYRKLNVPFKKSERNSQKRSWNSLPPLTKSASISTDSLKSLIPDFRVLCSPSVLNETEEKAAHGLEPMSSNKLHTAAPSSDTKLERTPSFESKKPKRRKSVKDSPLEPMEVDEHPKRTVLSDKPVSNIIFIRNLVRPFTLLQLKEVLKQTGTLVEDGFWIDKIKSKCLVTYENEEQAAKTREALHNSRWPSSNPKILTVEYVTKEEFEMYKNEGDDAKPIPSLHTLEKQNVHALETSKKKQKEEKERPKERERQRKAVIYIREWDKDKLTQESPEREQERHRSSKSADRSAEKERDRRGRASDSTKDSSQEDKVDSRKRQDDDTPAKLLDDLFQKTKATPCIYWLPLTEEQLKQREEECRLRRLEREKRNAEQEAERTARRKPRDKSRSRSRSPGRRR